MSAAAAATSSVFSTKELKSSLPQTKYIKKPLITSSLSSNSSSSASITASPLSPSTSMANSYSSSQTNLNSSSQQNIGSSSNLGFNSPSGHFHEHVTISNLPSKNAQACQAQASSALPSYYASVSPTTVASSTGAASSVLVSASNMNFNDDNNVHAVNSRNLDEKTKKTKIEEFEFMTTVGTGTFGRVIVVRDRQTRDYYALKVMSIAEVLRLKQTDHVRNEKEILLQVKHPFIINL